MKVRYLDVDYDAYKKENTNHEIVDVFINQKQYKTDKRKESYILISENNDESDIFYLMKKQSYNSYLEKLSKEKKPILTVNSEKLPSYFNVDIYINFMDKRYSDECYLVKHRGIYRLMYHKQIF